MTEQQHVWITEEIPDDGDGIGPSGMLAAHIRENSDDGGEYRRLHTMHCPSCTDAGRKAGAVVTFYADRDGREYRLTPKRQIQITPERVEVTASAQPMDRATSPKFTACLKCRTAYLLLSTTNAQTGAHWSELMLQEVIKSSYGKHPETGAFLVTYELTLSPPIAAMLANAAQE